MAAKSGWTVDTLRESHEHDIRLLQEEIDRRLVDLRLLLAERFAAQEKTIARTDTAVALRFESVNEFRQTLSDQTKTFVSRPELAASRESLESSITRVTDRLNGLELRVSTRLEQLGGRQEGGTLVGSTRRIDLALIFQALALAGVIVSLLFVAFRR